MDITKVHPRKVKTPSERKPLQILNKRAKKAVCIVFEEWQAHQAEIGLPWTHAPPELRTVAGVPFLLAMASSLSGIHESMTAQKDLVTIPGQFDPKLVKMAPHGELAED